MPGDDGRKISVVKNVLLENEAILAVARLDGASLSGNELKQHLACLGSRDAIPFAPGLRKGLPASED